MKIDKKAVVETVGLLMLSWAAFPFIYYLIVKRKKKKEEVREKDEIKRRNRSLDGGLERTD